MHRPTIAGPAGPEGNHFSVFVADGHPFHCSRRCRTMSRACAFYGRQYLSSGPIPHAYAAGSAARALSSAHLVESRHAHRF